MKNKIRSLIGALAIASTVSATDEFPFPVAPSYQAPVINSIEILGTNNIQQVQLGGNIYLGDTNHYIVQSSTNLVEGNWQDSTLNTNLYTRPGKAQQFLVAEPFDTGKVKSYYKLKSRN